jgi:hypothetical protein
MLSHQENGISMLSLTAAKSYIAFFVLSHTLYKRPQLSFTVISESPSRIKNQDVYLQVQMYLCHLNAFFTTSLPFS